MRKPTGQIGPTRVTATPAGVSSEFMPIDFGDSKVGVERRIASMFLCLAPEQNVFPHSACSLVQNEESDLDFTLISKDEKSRKLELMEIAPLEGVGGYSSASEIYRPYEFAKEILATIQKKSRKYGPPSSAEHHLLLYVTDWKFILSESVVGLLQYWTLSESHNFNGIYLFMPMEEREGVSRLIFPTPASFWSSYDPEAYRENVVHNINPRHIGES